MAAHRRDRVRRVGAPFRLRLRLPLLVFSLCSFAHAQAQKTPAARAPEKPPAPTPPAPAPPAPEAEPANPQQPGPAPEPAPGAPAATAEPSSEGEAVEAPSESAVDEASDAEEPVPEQAPPAEAPAPPETRSAPPAATAPVDPTATPSPADDDYAGATDAALVEESQGPKNLSLGVALDVTFPMGNSAKYIKSASIQGLSLDLRYYAWGNIGIGVGVALDSLSTKQTGTVTWDNATFTGTQVRELSYTPITLKGYYAWRDQGRAIPYVAAGVGAARSVRRLVVGISGLSEAAWHFALVPEAGLQIPVGPTHLLTNVRLNYLPASGGVEDQLFANFSVGLSIQ